MRTRWILGLAMGLAAACGGDDSVSDDAATAPGSGTEASTGGEASTSSAGTSAATLLTGFDASTGDGSSGGPPLEPGYAADIEPMFVERCQGNCHLVNWTLVLSMGQGYDFLVSFEAEQVPTMNRVEPGDPEASYLIHKLAGTHLDVGGEGERMPRNGPLLSADELAAVESWIADGAPP